MCGAAKWTEGCKRWIQVVGNRLRMDVFISGRVWSGQTCDGSLTVDAGREKLETVTREIRVWTGFLVVEVRRSVEIGLESGLQYYGVIIEFGVVGRIVVVVVSIEGSCGAEVTARDRSRRGSKVEIGVEQVQTP